MAAANAANGGVWEGSNPLETPELLEKVLSYVPPKDLKNARAVAKLWRDESLDNFRKSLIYVLDLPGSGWFAKPPKRSERLLKLSLGIQDNNGGHLLGQHPPDFPVTIYRLHDKPFKKFRLEGEQEFPPSDKEFMMEYFEGKRYFWEHCAPHVTHLYLKDRSNFERRSFVDGFIWLLKSCPNLEELTIGPMWAEGFNGGIRGDDDEFIGVKKIGPIGVEADGSLEGPKPRISKKDLVKMRENSAPNIKSLSVELVDIHVEMWRRPWDEEYDDPAEVADRMEYYYSTEHVNEWRYMLTLLPGLKNLSMDMDREFHYAMDALIEGSVTTGQLIQLESFTFNYRSVYPWHCTREGDIHFPPLLKYVGKLKDVGGSLKRLCLKKIYFDCFCRSPKSFRNILFHIRKTIEKMDLGIIFFEYMSMPLEEVFRFDFFSLTFPNLTELTLEFNFCRLPVPDPALVVFDFNVFRGTPNLKRFRLEYVIHDETKYLRKKIEPKDMEENASGEKANWDAVFTYARRYNQEPEFIDGDGTETFEVDGENEIVLEKMKEFYFTGQFTTEALLVLGKWMKNLKEIAVIFDNETLSIPFVLWPGTLKKLTVLEGSFEGEGISAKLISNLLEMYPEVEMVLEGCYRLILDGRGRITKEEW